MRKMGKKRMIPEAFKKPTEPLNIDIKCHRCGHEWIYRGLNPFYTGCPYCKTSVKTVKYNKEEDDEVKKEYAM